MLQEPERTCICCRSKKLKADLLRLVIAGNLDNKGAAPKIKSELIFDKKKQIQGRGYYICRQSRCIRKLKKSLKMKIEITTEQFRELEELLIEEGVEW